VEEGSRNLNNILKAPNLNRRFHVASGGMHFSTPNRSASSLFSVNAFGAFSLSNRPVASLFAVLQVNTLRSTENLRWHFHVTEDVSGSSHPIKPVVPLSRDDRSVVEEGH
jgi:hypothetical protein